MPVIRTAEQLEYFRRRITGRATQDLLKTQGLAALVPWPAGVGKSYWLDLLVEAAIRGDYELVLVLASRNQILDERKGIIDPPRGVRTLRLEARPEDLCGVARDKKWKVFEKGTLGQLGRKRVCKTCPHADDCFWPGLYSRENLAGVQVVYGTHAVFEKIPGLVELLSRATGASKILVLIDELDLLLKPFRREIDRHQLERWVETLEKMGASPFEGWLYLSRLLLQAPTEDLRCQEWSFPFPDSEWVLAVQEQGWDLHGENFRFLGYDLRQFGFSLLHSRERERGGSIRFACTPHLPCDLVVFSGVAILEFVEYRLGKTVANPFAEYRFQHAGTKFYNIRSLEGARKNFRGNRKRILDFFAALIYRRLREGKRVLLVSRQCFIADCRKGIEMRLRAKGMPEVHVVTDVWGDADLSSPTVIPIIGYGREGINRYEEFDCVYCLNSFFIPPKVLDGLINDLVGADLEIPVEIRFGDQRRGAGVANPRHRFFDVEWLADYALLQKEAGTVVQAIGRVRPFTKPREVVVFHYGDLPGIRYDREFRNLTEARQYFGLETTRESKKNETIRRVRQGREEGLSQSQTAAKWSLSVSTVKRYWKR